MSRRPFAPAPFDRRTRALFITLRVYVLITVPLAAYALVKALL